MATGPDGAVVIDRWQQMELGVRPWLKRAPPVATLSLSLSLSLFLSLAWAHGLLLPQPHPQRTMACSLLCSKRGCLRLGQGGEMAAAHTHWSAVCWVGELPSCRRRSLDVFGLSLCLRVVFRPERTLIGGNYTSAVLVGRQMDRWTWTRKKGE